MKKTILFALALISAWPCAAQKNPFKWWKSLWAAPARVAVVNDFPFFRNRVAELHRQERLFAGGTLHTYASADALLDAMLTRGERYGVIFTDIIISDGGGGRYFVGQLRDMGFDTPVIGCSMYTRDKIDSQELHNIGFDGYMYGDDMFEESAGFYKWAGYIKNYYYYKRIGNWHR